MVRDICKRYLKYKSCELHQNFSVSLSLPSIVCSQVNETATVFFATQSMRMSMSTSISA